MMRKKLLVFCSNPTDGGTAEMFVQCCLALRDKDEFEVIPCVNKNNSVKVFNMLDDLVRLGITSEVECRGPYQHGDILFAHLFNRISRGLRYRSTKKQNKKTIQSFLRANDIESVLIHNGGYVGDDLCNQVLQAAYWIGIPGKRIMVFHGTAEKRPFQKIRFFLYDRMINRCATEIITGSNYSKDRLIKETNIRNIYVVPNGISYEGSVSNEEKKSNVQYKEDADIQIVNVANFYYSKGQMHLLNAFEKLHKNTDLKLRLTFIGHALDQNYYNECVQYIKEHGLDDDVVIVDNIFNSREYMNIFDIAVVSSLGGEDLPMVPIEAMRSGVPTVAYACNGVPEEITHNENGLLVKVGNVEELYWALKQLVEDDDLRNCLGINALKKYEECFTRQQMGNRYTRVVRGW